MPGPPWRASSPRASSPGSCASSFPPRGASTRPGMASSGASVRTSPRAGAALGLAMRGLEASSPEAVLARGYAVVRMPSGPGRQGRLEPRGRTGCRYSLCPGQGLGEDRGDREMKKFEGTARQARGARGEDKGKRLAPRGGGGRLRGGGEALEGSREGSGQDPGQGGDPSQRAGIPRRKNPSWASLMVGRTDPPISFPSPSTARLPLCDF